MASIVDNFNLYIPSQTLDAQADWVCDQEFGTGVMSIDQHDDHSDGSNVIDMSDVGGQIAIHATPMTSTNHFAQVEVFIDTLSTSDNAGGVIIRGNGDDLATLDGYMAYFTQSSSGPETLVSLARIDNGSLTTLDTTSDLDDTPYGDRDIPRTLCLTGYGDHLVATIDGVQVAEADDATYSGDRVGIYMARATSAIESQPFLDNFRAGTGATLAVLAAGGCTGNNFNTTVITPSADCGLILFVIGNPSSSATPFSSGDSASGGSLTWTKQAGADDGQLVGAGAVYTAIIGASAPGTFQVTWDGTDGSAGIIDSGVYFIVKTMNADTTTPFVGASAEPNHTGNGPDTLTLAATPVDGDAVAVASFVDAAGAVFTNWEPGFLEIDAAGAIYGGGTVGLSVSHTTAAVDATDINETTTENFSSGLVGIIVKSITPPLVEVVDYSDSDFTDTWSNGEDIDIDPGVNWQIGDTIVVIAMGENEFADFGTPVHADLTFDARVTLGATASQATLRVWTALADTVGTAEIIVAEQTGGLTSNMGIAVLVVSGVDYDSISVQSNRTESAFLVNPTEGSMVVYGMADWEAETPHTLLTGTGTPAELVDFFATGAYSGVIGTWTGATTGAANYGVSTYAGKVVSHFALVLPPPADEATIPGAIDDLDATSGNEQVILTWTAPDDGGGTISDYIIQYRVS